jgi:hypothetical protein
MSTITKIANRLWVSHIDDERADGNSIIVTLDSDFVFDDERDCGVRGFDTLKDAEQGTRLNSVINKKNVMRDQFMDKTIVHIGDAWRVVGVGAQRDGNTFCHLASTTRFRQQKNGKNPVQIGDWVDTEVLKAAR